MSRIHWIFAITLSGSAQTLAPGTAGSLTGTLSGNDGTRIAGGTVSLISVRVEPQNASGRPSPRRDGHVARSDAGGTFRFDQLLAGSYAVCAQLPKSQWLNSCDWGSKPLSVSISPDISGTVAIVLRKGALVPIRVDDPNRALSQAKEKGLLVGVGGNDKLFRPAVLVTEDPGGRTYQSLIPFDVPVKLVLSSPSFQLANELGAPLQAKTTALTYRVPATQVPVPVRVVITGARNP